MKQILPERLAELPSLSVDYQDHIDFQQGHCTMELVAWLAGEKHTDQPNCACPWLSSLMRQINDEIFNKDERTTALLPLVPYLVGTAGSPELQKRRRLRVRQWVRETIIPHLCAFIGLKEEATAYVQNQPLAKYNFQKALEKKYQDSSGLLFYPLRYHSVLSLSAYYSFQHDDVPIYDMLQLVCKCTTKEELQTLEEFILREFHSVIQECCLMEDPKDAD